MVENTITARAFELVDADGVRRAVLGTDPRGDSALQFFGRDGEVKAELSLDANDAPGFALSNSTGRVVMFVDQNGGGSIRCEDNERRPRIYLENSAGGSGLLLYGQDGVMRLRVAVDQEDEPNITIKDKDGNQRFLIATTKLGALIQGNDSKKRARFVILIQDDGTTSIELRQTRSTAPVVIRLNPDGSYEGSFEQLPTRYEGRPDLRLVQKDSENEDE
jgi:hypothetical protein